MAISGLYQGYIRAISRAPRLLTFGKHISGVASNTGSNRLPNPDMADGMIKKKSISIACMMCRAYVTTTFLVHPLFSTIPCGVGYILSFTSVGAYPVLGI